MNNELIFVYGLIAIVIALIIFIIVMDKKESKKQNQNLFDTLNMKIIADPETIKAEQEELTETEIFEIKSEKQVEDFENLKPIKEAEVVEDKILDEIVTDDLYIETDLEKTQAQIRVEEITKALEKAESLEKQEKDKYEQFEEEQEKNAIISYNELKKSFDKIYSENEKIQYLEDDEIPINIEELYRIKDQETNKVELKDFSDIKQTPPKINTNTSTFKNSPYISPVYGIQEPPVETKKVPDIEIENANKFLQNLKELKNNLD